jgi:hypothetical protein
MSVPPDLEYGVLSLIGRLEQVVKGKSVLS